MLIIWQTGFVVQKFTGEIGQIALGEYLNTTGLIKELYKCF